MPNKQDSSRSWFCVLNNPEKVLGEHTPEELVYLVVDMWCNHNPQRSAGANYEISDSGTPHMHMVLEDPAKTRFSAVQKLFPGMHIEPTRGSKKDAEDYLYKRGRFSEKGHTIKVQPYILGELKAQRGKRNDMRIIDEMIEQGKKPNEIMEMGIYYRHYEKDIIAQYIDKRCKETPTIREVTVYWHVGESGSGKSYTQMELYEKFGEEEVYLMTDYENGGFDNYMAEKVLFIDEFKANMTFTKLLTLLDVYKTQIHCRYANKYALWTEVHITSIFPPEEAYRFMVEDSQQSRDKLTQLLRRLSFIVFHYVENGEYKTYMQPGAEYKDYNTLKSLAIGDEHGFIPVSESDENCPFVVLR